MDDVGKRLQVADPAHSVEVRQPKEQKSRGENAQVKILGCGLLRCGVAPGQVEQEVGGNAHELEASEQEDQLVCRRDQHGSRVNHQQRAEELGRAGVIDLVDARSRAGSGQ